MNALLKVLFISAVAVASSTAWPFTGTRSALIVGVSTYNSPSVPPLKGVPHDIANARAMARAMGIPDDRMTVLLDSQATKAAILVALERLASAMNEGGRAFIYFTGHGTRWYEPSAKGCREGLLAYDRRAITNEEIAQRIKRLGEMADKVVVVFDACHSDGVRGAGQPKTRSIAAGGLTPKFSPEVSGEAQVCDQVSNMLTRSLLAESTKLGALEENFVQITSARADEVSFDDPEKGGLATQGLTQCLLSSATDSDGSGAASIREIEVCAQRIVNEKLKPFPDLRPHHIRVIGNRNIVPVAVVRPPQASAQLVEAPPASIPPVQTPTPVAAPANPPPAPPSPPPLPVALIPVLPPASALPAQPAAAEPVIQPPAPTMASLATLKDIEQQRNPRRKVDVKLSRSELRIGKDPLQLTVTSSHAGHVYLVMLGSDGKSFYLLFPNGLDSDNRIAAGKPLSLPRPDWQLMARGPTGENHLLVLVADTPRDLTSWSTAPPSAAAPFTYSLTDLPGRTSLLEFLIGRGVTGTSESFGARLLSIKEVK